MISATFSLVFSGFWARLGSCFSDFSGFSYLFWRFFRLFRWVWGAVLWISAVSATFFKNFSGCFAVVGGAVLWISAVSATFFKNFSSFWAGLGNCFRSFMDYSYPRPACYQPMAIVHCANLVWGILC